MAYQIYLLLKFTVPKYVIFINSKVILLSEKDTMVNFGYLFRPFGFIAPTLLKIIWVSNLSVLSVTWWRLFQKRTWWGLFQKRTWWRLFQKRTWWRLFQKRTWWRLFQKRTWWRLFQKRTWWRLFQKRTWWRLFQKRTWLSSFQKRTWWRLFQKRVVRTKFDIYVFITSNIFSRKEDRSKWTRQTIQLYT